MFYLLERGTYRVMRKDQNWLQRHKLLVAILFLPLLLAGFLVIEHVRGSISLARYMRNLRAQGETISATAFRLPRPLPGDNGAPEVLAAVKDLQPGNILPKSY